MFLVVYTLAILAAFSRAAPTLTKDNHKAYYGITVDINTSSLSQTPVHETVPVQINALTSLGTSTFGSKLQIDSSSAQNVVLSSVECRAFKDQAGVVPGSLPFTFSQLVQLSTDAVRIQSVLCYITEGS
ncbi:hypothetical protein M433DRAFT_3277 [Acidomyces richmondensis BFW]|nr:MAG: hypothetical protein FE78DRAFT_29955 [Acidomyces sp. 'richmondensis']KYG46929.1 hypothetical protein M433DRAFT_3277 [Acidomyces richmondensis BFW]